MTVKVETNVTSAESQDILPANVAAVVAVVMVGMAVVAMVDMAVVVVAVLADVEVQAAMVSFK